MSYFFQKACILFLISVFAFSCFGTSAGMILHDSFTDYNEHLIHSCCGLSENTAAQNAVHHDLQFYAGKNLLFLLIFSAGQGILLFALHSTIRFDQIVVTMRLYLRRWGELFQYVANFLLRLFSSGILHSKAW